MTIVKPEAPKEGYGVVEQALGVLSDHPAVMALLAPANTVEVMPPLAVHMLDRDEIMRGAVASQKPVATWRYLIGSGQAMGAADLHVRDGALHFARLDHGRIVQQLYKALTLADAVFSAREDEVKLAIVESPPLYAAALWLKSLGPDPERDCFIPYFDGTQEGPAIQPRSDYLDVLKAKLEERKGVARFAERPSN
ncbi:MAG: hypothetical protein JOZ72_08550 [Alphaproteobacteria bacterium]|nr:hypothetical protein [Alphaproteobacteria bacterium]